MDNNQPAIEPTSSGPKKPSTKIYWAIVAAIVAVLIGFALYLAHQQKIKPSAPSVSNSGVGPGLILPGSTANQSADNRNAERKADVNTILNAVYQYSIDSQGHNPAGITSTPKDICVTSDSSTTNCAGLLDLSVLTSDGQYLVAIPKDPLAGTDADSHYQISVDAGGRITVSAPDAEDGQPITATR